MGLFQDRHLFRAAWEEQRQILGEILATLREQNMSSRKV